MLRTTIVALALVFCVVSAQMAEPQLEETDLSLEQMQTLNRDFAALSMAEPTFTPNNQPAEASTDSDLASNENENEDDLTSETESESENAKDESEEDSSFLAMVTLKDSPDFRFTVHGECQKGQVLAVSKATALLKLFSHLGMATVNVTAFPGQVSDGRGLAGCTLVFETADDEDVPRVTVASQHEAICTVESTDAHHVVVRAALDRPEVDPTTTLLLGGAEAVATACSCPPGTFVTWVAGSQCGPCIPCPPGTFASGASGAPTTCDKCQAGFYASNIGSSSCVAAAPGSFAPMSGMEQALLCPMGYDQPQAGQSTCLACQPGTFQAYTGSSSCTQCPLNTYGMLPAQAGCVPCPPGTHTTQPGATSCTNAPQRMLGAKLGKPYDPTDPYIVKLASFIGSTLSTQVGSAVTVRNVTSADCATVAGLKCTLVMLVYYSSNSSQSIGKAVVYDRFGTMSLTSFAPCTDPTCGIPPPPVATTEEAALTAADIEALEPQPELGVVPGVEAVDAEEQQAEPSAAALAEQALGAVFAQQLEQELAPFSQTETEAADTLSDMLGRAWDPKDPYIQALAQFALTNINQAETGKSGPYSLLFVANADCYTVAGRRCTLTLSLMPADSADLQNVRESFPGLTDELLMKLQAAGAVQASATVFDHFGTMQLVEYSFA